MRAPTGVARNGSAPSAMVAPPSMRERFTWVTAELLRDDPRAVAVMADISVGRLQALGADAFPDERLVNVGIREQLLIGVASGFAMEGFRPIAHSYVPFLVERPFEQLKLDLGHQGVGAVLVSTGASYDSAGAGRTHHGPGDVHLLASLPGWTVHVPGHADEAEAALRRSMETDEPVYIRLAEASNSRPRRSAVGGAIQERRGSPGAPLVVAVGPMLDPTLEAVRDLDVTVLYTPSPRPFLERHLELEDARDVILVEPVLEGTSLAALVGRSSEPRRYLAVGVGRAELRRYGSREDHDRAHGLDARGIRERVDAFLT